MPLAGVGQVVLASSGSGAPETRLLVVGGEDVHRRIDLLRLLSNSFVITAAGSSRQLQDRFSEAGFDYYYYPLSRGISPFSDLASVFRLFQLIRRLRPHVVHTFGTKPSVWGRLAARLAGTPVVVGTLPGLGSLYVGGGPGRRLLRAVYGTLQWICCRISDATVFQNADDARELERAGIIPSAKSVIVPGSGIRTDVFDPSRVSASERNRLRDELGVGSNTIVVTMVSRLIRSKGVAEFARAAQMLKLDSEDVAFVLVGPDDQQSVERLTARELAMVRESVRWLGERSDVRVILAASDVAVLPSFYREGIPRVLLEAAAMALPIISTRSPGCKEVVQEGVNGILVEARSPEALAAAIERLVSDSDLRRQLGATSRSRCIERFDISVVVQQTEALYCRLLGCPRTQNSAEEADTPQQAPDRSSHTVSVSS
jgi:glycosyltransferase involved in cell wall biosynthesis